MIRLARAAAPALDLIVRTLLDNQQFESIEGLVVTFHPSTLGVEVRPRLEDFEELAEIVIEAFTRDAWTMHTVYDNGNAVTGKRVGWRFGHPVTQTRMGHEAQGRPNTLRVDLPMPDRSLALDGSMITRMCNEAYNVVNDILSQQAVKEADTRVKPLHKSPLAILSNDEDGDTATYVDPNPTQLNMPKWALSDGNLVKITPNTKGLELDEEDDERG